MTGAGETGAPLPVCCAEGNRTDVPCRKVAVARHAFQSGHLCLLPEQGERKWHYRCRYHVRTSAKNFEYLPQAPLVIAAEDAE